MEDCCAPRVPDGYDREFNSRFARRLARAYRRHGLTTTGRLILDFAASVGLDGATVLEIGGGIGDIQLEALKKGAAHTTNVELSSAYEPEAVRLLDDAGMRDRATRILGIDLAITPDAIGLADVVVLHRVVCCYPDSTRLLSAAAGHGRRALVFSYPTRSLSTRVLSRLGNTFFALTGNPYRFFAHDPNGMIDVVRRHGFETRPIRRSGPWCIVGAIRT